MMRISRRRTYYVRRWLAAITALCLMFATTGPGLVGMAMADGVVSQDTTATITAEQTAVADGTDGGGAGQEDPQVEPVVLEGAPEEPASDEAAPSSSDAGGDPAGTVSPSVSSDEAAAGASGATEETASPDTAKDPASQAAPLLTSPSVQLELDGYRLTPSAGWKPSNLGKDYTEGEWVPYRFIVHNTGSSSLSFGAFSVVYDHYGSTKNAVGFDRTRYWRSYLTGDAPAEGDASGPAGSPVSPSVQDAGAMGSDATLHTDFPAGTLTIPAGQYAVVYFQAHLAVTAYWRSQDPSRDGSGFYPGSSLQMRVESPSGDRTVSLPDPPAPEGGIEGLKYNDLDADGEYDEGEPPLSGWVFRLTGGTTEFPVDLTATSGTDGTFSFPDLIPGTYQITETQHSGWESKTSFPIYVTVGSATESVKVGNYQARSDLTVQKYEDMDADGVWETGEPFLSGWTFTLSQNDSSVSSTTEGSDGKAIFAELAAGSYDLTETLKAGWHASDTWPRTVTQVSGQDQTIKAGNWREASISVYKFDDKDGDGVKDPGDTAIENWAFTLTGPGTDTTERTAYTDASGVATFTGLKPGTYTLDEPPAQGWFQTSGGLPMEITVESGDQVAELEVGNAKKSDLTVQKYEDVDADGIWETGEPFLTGWDFTLSKDQWNETSTTAGADGKAIFASLAPGSYDLTETLKPGWHASDTWPKDIEMVSGQDQTIQAGNWRDASVSVYKFDDKDGDGVRDPGDTAIENWAFTLTGPGADTTNRTAYTDANGVATFTGLKPGIYTLDEPPAQGWFQTTGGLPKQITVESGDEVSELEVGNSQRSDLTVQKYEDEDADGVWDEGEPFLSDWDFTLSRGEWSETSTTVGAEGKAIFGELDAGSYQLTETLKPGWHASDTWPKTMTQVSGQDQTIQAGNWQDASVDVSKFDDKDGDGVKDAEDTPIGNWAFTLAGPAPDPTVRTELTGADGIAHFTGLHPGTYTLDEPPVQGWFQTTGGLPKDITLTSGQHEREGLEVGNSSYADLVVEKYEDVDADGVFDQGEALLPEWEFTLTAQNTNAPYGRTEVTDAEGAALFGGVPPGSYELTETLKEGWHASNTWPMDVGMVSGQDQTITVGNWRDAQIDVLKYEDMNGNGIRDANDPPVEDWTITLFDGKQQTLYVETGADGIAHFTGLKPGTYWAGEWLRQGWNVSSDIPVEVTVGSGETGTAEIGNLRPGDVVVRKYEDLDADGVFDPDEPLLPDWEFTLTGEYRGPVDAPSGNFIRAIGRTETTNDDGIALFFGARPGSYELTETLKEGWHASNEWPMDVEVLSAQDQTITVGNWRDGGIDVLKYEDLDGDGERDENEPVISDWTFTLFDGESTDYATTGADGIAHFTGIRPGEYELNETLWEDWFNSTDLPVSITVVSGHTETTEVGNLRKSDLVVRKYEDLDADGEFEEGEPLLPDWEFTLSRGEWEQEALTGDNGSASFADLVPGSYELTETLQEGWHASDKWPRGVEMVSGRDATITVGNWRDGEIDILKYEDMDADGERDDNEPVIEDWTFELFDGESTHYETTDGDGIASFKGLRPGAYLVGETLPDGWFVSRMLPIPVTVESGDVKTEEVGNYRRGDVVVRKYEDLDADGVFDQGEPLLPDWEFTLTGGALEYYVLGTPSRIGQIGPPTRSEITNADGIATFDDLRPASYELTETLKEGWHASNEWPMDVGVVSGQDQTITVGNWREGEVDVFKFDDKDGDGVRDTNEPPIAQWAFTLKGPGTDTTVRTAFTNASGIASFSGLRPGDYTLDEPLAQGWFQTTGGLPKKVTVVSGQATRDLTVGNSKKSSITVQKYEDKDADGVWDEGEPYLADWTFRLSRGESSISSTTVGSDGKAVFADLVPGAYELTETLKPGWRTSSSLPMTITQTSGTDQLVKVGNWREADVDVFKFNDADGDGIHDTGEGGIVRTFTLVGPSSASVTRTGSTDGNGDLSFTGLTPGSYTLSEPATDGTYESTKLLPVTFTIAPGESKAFEIGNTTYIDLSGTKFNDVTGDGIRQPADPGLPGWVIALYKQGAQPIATLDTTPSAPAGFSLVATTSTAADGSYHFGSVVPGLYFLAEVAQAGWDRTVGPAGPFEVAAGAVKTGLDFGNWVPFIPYTPPDMGIAKTVDKTIVKPGDELIYKLIYTNTGQGSATGIVITDDYDESVMQVVDAAGGSDNGTTITWTIAGPLAPGGSGAIVYRMRVKDTVPEGVDKIDNTAAVSIPGVVDPTPPDDVAKAQVTLDPPFLPFTPPSEETSESSLPSLPFTGMDVWALLLVSAILTGSGMSLRWMLRRKKA